VITADMSLPIQETPDVETSSEGYARRFSGEVGRYFLETQNATVLDLLAPWPGAKVFDVGGGFSRMSERVSSTLGLTRWLGSPIVLRIEREERDTK
jgi:hypothetical protein